MTRGDPAMRAKHKKFFCFFSKLRKMAEALKCDNVALSASEKFCTNLGESPLLLNISQPQECAKGALVHPYRTFGLADFFDGREKKGILKGVLRHPFNTKCVF